jgi:DNA gyrase inhibitor GyrI
MEPLDVRIVRLEPLRVASVHAFGPGPEGMAWENLVAWAGPRGLMDGSDHHRIFGFNNPSPTAGSPNYGYEFWLELQAGDPMDGPVAIKEFEGGLYAVTRCQGVDNITPTWRQLSLWREHSTRRIGSHQWLERHIGPADDPEQLVLDLYLPIIG